MIKFTLQKLQATTKHSFDFAKYQTLSLPSSTDKIYSKSCRSMFDLINNNCSGRFLKELNLRDSNDEQGIEIPISFSATHSVSTFKISKLADSAFSAKGAHFEEWRKFGADSFLYLKGKGSLNHAILLPELEGLLLQDALTGILEGVELASYEFLKYKSKTKTPLKSKKKRNIEVAILYLSNSNSIKHPQIIKRSQIMTQSICYARDLVNTAPSDLGPSDLVKIATKLAKDHRRVLSTKIYTLRDLKKLGAGGIIGVGQGSKRPPYLIHLNYKPKGKTKGKILLIGKGVTFDSGGLSLKTGKGMEDMKCDMAGAAAVLGTLQALSQLYPKGEFPYQLEVLIPTVENMPSGESIRPGDVVRMINNKTVEVLNTDAEGRLILADALSFAERLKPDVIIDLATLTGACVVALGGKYAGLFSNDKNLEQSLIAAGSSAGENLWPLPLAKEYKSQIKSTVSDLRNISLSGGPGAIIGALFLEEFVPEKTSWAHLDIAGPAFITEKSKYLTVGGTGFGVRTLIAFLEAKN
jgi:leucyl aminopeptidase